MYELVDRLDPELYYELARATYAEMALAGITAVGEFHYLHHDRGGRRYADPNAMGQALLAAAADAGIRITLIDTCYLQAGVGGDPLEASQQRFSDGNAEAWATRVDALSGSPTARIAAAIHSVRAVDLRSMATVRDWTHTRNTPLHVHASEQPRENEECIGVRGSPHRRCSTGRGCSARRRPWCTPPTSPSPTSSCWDRPQPPSACARRPSAILVTASGRRMPWPRPVRR